jgi:hypothetical protein
MHWEKIKILRSCGRAVSFVGFVVALGTLFSQTSLAQSFHTGARLHVLVHDESDQPIGTADVQLKRRDGVITTSTTDQKGEVEFTEVSSGTYELVVVKAEFQTIKQDDVVITAGHPVEIEFVLSRRSNAGLARGTERIAGG